MGWSGRRDTNGCHPAKILVAISVVGLLLVLAGAGPALAAADDDIPGQDLALGQQVTGSVDVGSDKNDVYGLALTSGEEVHVRAKSTGTSLANADMHWMVLGATSVAAPEDYELISARLFQSQFLYSEPEFDYVPPHTGRYFSWFEALEGSLSYELEVTRTSRAPITTADTDDIPGVPIGEEALLRVVDTFADHDDLYSVKLFAGEPVTIRLEPLGADMFGSAWLGLLTPDSTSISSWGTYDRAVPLDSNAHNAVNFTSDTLADETAVLQFTPSETGVYPVWVESGNIGSNLPYRLSITGHAERPGGGPPPPTGFPDVTPSHPYYEAITGIADEGIINGYTNGEFGPEDPVKRAQFAKMIDGTMGVQVSEAMTSPFTDLGPDDQGDLYPHEYVAAAAAAGITTGVTPTTFAPYNDISRAQVVTMIVRAAEGLAPGVLDQPPAGYAGTVPSFSAIHSPNMRIAEYNGLLEGLTGFGGSWDPWAKSSRGECAQMLWNLMLRMR